MTVAWCNLSLVAREDEQLIARLYRKVTSQLNNPFAYSSPAEWPYKQQTRFKHDVLSNYLRACANRRVAYVSRPVGRLFNRFWRRQVQKVPAYWRDLLKYGVTVDAGRFGYWEPKHGYYMNR